MVETGCYNTRAGIVLIYKKYLSFPGRSDILPVHDKQFCQTILCCVAAVHTDVWQCPHDYTVLPAGLEHLTPLDTAPTFTRFPNLETTSSLFKHFPEKELQGLSDPLVKVCLLISLYKLTLREMETD